MRNLSVRIAGLRSVALVAVALASRGPDAALGIGQQPPAGHSLTLRRELIIGGADAADVLTIPGYVAMARDGSTFIAQPLDSRILVYDNAGKRTRVIGREGGGPGEFRAIWGMNIVGDDLFVADRVNQRLTTFTLAGKTLRTLGVVSHPSQSKILHDIAQIAFSDGSVAAVPTPAEWSADSVPLDIYSRTGRFVRTLLQLKTSEGFYPVKTKRLSTSVERPDAHSDLYGFLPSENIVLIVNRSEDERQSTVTIRKISVQGSTLWRKSFSRPPAVITPAELNREIDRRAKILYEYRKNIMTQAEAREVYALGYKTVRLQGAVDNLTVGQDGTFWLRSGAFGRTSAEWTAYDRNGVARGLVTLPSSSKVMMVSANKVWITEFDEDDVPSLVRYSVN